MKTKQTGSIMLEIQSGGGSSTAGEHLPKIKRKKMKGVQKLYFRPPNYEELRKKIVGD